jgi:hypothetical protein
MDGKAFVCTVISEKENFNTSTQFCLRRWGVQISSRKHSQAKTLIPPLQLCDLFDKNQLSLLPGCLLTIIICTHVDNKSL